ncbi:MAG: class II aldolase/adducin family protein, partial [Burkholderiaceae bacterium]
MSATTTPPSTSTRAASARPTHFESAHFDPAHFEPDEWAARLQLAACYRIVAHLGWTELIYNHITLR